MTVGHLSDEQLEPVLEALEVVSGRARRSLGERARVVVEWDPEFRRYAAFALTEGGQERRRCLGETRAAALRELSALLLYPARDRPEGAPLALPRVPRPEALALPPGPWWRRLWRRLRGR